MVNLLSLRSFDPATIPQPRLLGSCPTLPAQLAVRVVGQATQQAAFLLFCLGEPQLPHTVLRAAVLLAHCLPFVRGEVTRLIPECQIPGRNHQLALLTSTR